MAVSSAVPLSAHVTAGQQVGTGGYEVLQGIKRAGPTGWAQVYPFFVNEAAYYKEFDPSKGIAMMLAHRVRQGPPGTRWA